jgi:branched-chain amino acid transport system permease protein
MSHFVQALYNGLAVAAVYALVATGITLIFGLTRLVNFAQGEMLSLGAFLCYSLVTVGIPFWLALAITTLAVGLGSEVLDLGLFRRTLGNPINGFIVSLGLIEIFESFFALRYGTTFYEIKPPFSVLVHVGGVILDGPRTLIIISAALVCGGLFAALEWTNIGRGIRALSEDGMAARVLGVPVGLLISLTFIVGSAVSALGGAEIGTVFPFTAYSGYAYLLPGFAAAIIGGLGNVRGAVVASLIVAMAQTIGAAYVSLAWSPAFGLAAMAVVILFRPRGLFRGSEGGDAASHFVGSAKPPREASGSDFARRWRKFVPYVAIGAVLLAVPVLRPTYRELSIATFAVIMALLAYVLWVPLRYGGVVALMQATLMGVGCYTAAVLATKYKINFWVQLPAAILIAGAVSAAIGLFAVRTRGTYFLILTAAVAEILVIVFSNWVSVTNGFIGIIYAPPPDPLGPISFEPLQSFYYLAVAFLAIVIALILLFGRSRIGRRLIAVRDNETLAMSLGLNTYMDKVVVLGLAGAVAGAAGVLFLYQEKGIDPTLFGTAVSTNLFLIVVLGGRNYLLAPILGAAVYAFLPEVLKLPPNAAGIAYGVVLIAVILLMPDGIFGTLQDYFAGTFPAWFRRLIPGQAGSA